MPEIPIIKVFIPDNVEQSAQAKLESISIKLQDDVTRQKVIEALNKYGVKALIIAPDYSPSRVRDTGSELISYFLPGKRHLTGLREIRLATKIEEVFGESKMLGFSFNRENEQGWVNAYRITDPRQNPVTQVFAELDARKMDT